MDCITKNKEGSEILLDYSAGTLDAVRAAELREHIRDCAECARLVQAQNTVWEALDAWSPAEVSPDFDAKLYARIAQEQRKPLWRAFWKPLPVAAAVAVLSLALLMVVPDWNDRLPAPPPSPAAAVAQQQAPSVQQQVQPQLQPGNIDVDQVEQALEDFDLMTPSAM